MMSIIFEVSCAILVITNFIYTRWEVHRIKAAYKYSYERAVDKLNFEIRQFNNFVQQQNAAQFSLEEQEYFNIH